MQHSNMGERYAFSLPSWSRRAICERKCRKQAFSQTDEFKESGYKEVEDLETGPWEGCEPPIHGEAPVGEEEVPIGCTSQGNLH